MTMLQVPKWMDILPVNHYLKYQNRRYVVGPIFVSSLVAVVVQIEPSISHMRNLNVVFI